MLRYLLVGFLMTVVYCETGLAQGPLKKKLDAARRGATAGKQSENDSNDKRNDVEGTIWEFKVMDRKEKDKSKQTKMTRKFRMKQTSVFSVGDVVMVGGQANQQKAKNDSADVKGQLKSLLSQRMKKVQQKDTGGDRVGDFSKSKSNEYIIRFDEDKLPNRFRCRYKWAQFDDFAGCREGNCHCVSLLLLVIRYGEHTPASSRFLRSSSANPTWFDAIRSNLTPHVGHFAANAS